MINFYKNKKELEFMNKDLICLFFDFHFKKEALISLLEKKLIYKDFNKTI